MPAKKTAAASSTAASAKPTAVVERSESLRATDEERLATSKSLYGDYKARISSNTHHIHDRTRARAYINAIKTGMQGKRVLHLGCGMGYLSILAGQLAAAHVVAVDSSTIVQAARVVAQQNKVPNLTFIQGSLHQGTATLPAEHQQFDVILCEWMSSFVTNDLVLVRELAYCRDKFLAPQGIICPSEATLSVAAITDYEYKCSTVDYWDNVYGFNMAPMKELVMREPTGCAIPKHLVKTRLQPVVTIKASEINAENPSFEGTFELAATAKSTLHFLTFFVAAAHRDAANPNSNFDLPCAIGGPNAWAEVSAALPEALPVFPGDTLQGAIHVAPKGGDTELTVQVKFKNSLVEHSSSTVHHFQY